MAGTEDGQSAEALYTERHTRLYDSISLKEVDRVPFAYATRFWAATHAGITFEEAMYDADKAIQATRDVLELLQPDLVTPSIYAFGQTLEAMDYKPMQWPGHGTDPNVCFQYLDKEYMTPDEYDEYLFDPTGFYLSKYLPRIAGAFEGLEHFPKFPGLSEWGFVSGMRGFANPELRKAFARLIEAGEHMEAASKKIIGFSEEVVAAGYPLGAGGFCKAPFDQFSDFMRGSKGGMLDMFRHKDKLLESIDKAGELLVRGVAESAQKSGCPIVFIPLHWGLDGFMSPDQFQTFFWPSLRKIVLRLIDEGAIPCLLWEGDCTTRLEHIGDIPKGKAIYWFERTDLVLAKEVLGDTVCLRGNVPPSLLIAGTPDDVDEYCRNLIEKVGKGGGFILDGAASIPDEAPTANIVAMANSVRKYAG
jgi:uroporphyrinogen-III decarboxylase